MPTYTFMSEDGVEYEEFMSMSEMEQYKKDYPKVRQVFTPIALAGDHLMGVGPKTDEGFKENMQRIAAAHPGSAMADRFGGETTKEQKTRAVLKKHGAI